MLGFEGFFYAWIWAQYGLFDSEPPAAATGPDDGIEVEIGGVRSNRGIVRCELLRRDERLSQHPPETAVARVAVRAVAGQVTCRFTGVAGGSYAVSAAHDEHGVESDSVLLASSPPRGACAGGSFGRDTAGRLDPPDIAPAIFTYVGGLHLLRLRLRY